MGNILTRCARGRKRQKQRDVNLGEPENVPVSSPQSPNGDSFFRYGSLSRSSIRRGLSRQESQFRRNPAIGFQVTDSYAQNAEQVSRGFAFIFETSEFDPKLKEKYGITDHPEHAKDAADLKDVLSTAGFEVCHYKNFTEANARSVLKLYTTGDKLLGVDSFVCIILTTSIKHRKTGETQIAFHDKFVPRRKLYNPARKCAVLSGVPKIFVSPTCTPSYPASLSPENSEGTGTLTRHSVDGVAEDSPAEPDFLFIHSLIEKLCSTQYPELGSYFIQKLVSVLMYNSSRPEIDSLSLLTLLARALQDVNRSEGKSPGSCGVSVSSTLRKDFFFFRCGKRNNAEVKLSS